MRINLSQLSSTQTGSSLGHEASYIDFQTCTEHISALFSSPVTDDSIYSLCGRLDEAIAYFNYDTIELCIHSPGGSVAALKYFNACRERWENKGIRLRTIALNEACSAAAFMLSCGTLGERVAKSHSTLVYHFGRLSSENVFGHMQSQTGGQLTAKRSKQAVDKLLSLQRMMVNEDEYLLGYLFQHIFGDARKANAWAKFEALERLAWAKQWLKGLARNKSVLPPLNEACLAQMRKTANRLQRVADSPEKLVEKVKEEICQLFDRDEPIHAFMAYLLLLVDRIDGPGGTNMNNHFLGDQS
jgi:ATP-dependent protease ClpP protease subunit